MKQRRDVTHGIPVSAPMHLSSKMWSAVEEVFCTEGPKTLGGRDFPVLWLLLSREHQAKYHKQQVLRNKPSQKQSAPSSPWWHLKSFQLTCSQFSLLTSQQFWGHGNYKQQLEQPKALGHPIWHGRSKHHLYVKYRILFTGVFYR